MKKLLAKLGIADMPSFWKFVLQFLKFGIVGVSNTLISLGCYYILIQFNIHYIIANTIGFIVSVLNSYFWNSKFVFNKSTKNRSDEAMSKKTTLIKTFAAYGVTFLLSTLLLFMFIEKLLISKTIAPLISLCITIPLNFFLNRFWVYE